MHVVRGSKRLLTSRHHLQAAQLTEAEWRARRQAGRRFLQADGESGKRYGNETIRITPDGEVSIELPAPLAHQANAPRGRYVLAARVVFAHRGEQWRDRAAANRAVAYRIHEDVQRGRWYVTASWTIPPAAVVPPAAARVNGMVGVDTNADHLAAWRLDQHGNPVGQPLRFGYDLTGSSGHRDAQVRHALIRLLRFAQRHALSPHAMNVARFATVRWSFSSRGSDSGSRPRPACLARTAGRRGRCPYWRPRSCLLPGLGGNHERDASGVAGHAHRAHAAPRLPGGGAGAAQGSAVGRPSSPVAR